MAGGCRFGSQCRFSHDDPGGTSSADFVSSTSGQTRSSPAGRGRGRGRGAPTSSSSAGRAPNGVCNTYWASGACNREFACRFRHIQSGGHESPRPQDVRSTAIDTIAPFLTESGLAKVTGIGTDVFFSVNSGRDLSPSEAHTHMTKFLVDSFRFRTAHEIYAFMKVVNSANTSNKLWTQEDGQLWLSNVATGNGLLRMIDVIQWPAVSVKAGASRDVLSFQRGFMPVVQYMSSEYVVKSTLGYIINGLYSSVIMENFKHFSEVVDTCISEGFAARSFKEVTVSSSESSAHYYVASLAQLLFECLTRFKNATATHPELGPLVLKLKDWTETWISGVSVVPPTFENPFQTSSVEAREHIIRHLRNKVDQLVAIVEREQGRINRASQNDSGASAVPGRAHASEAIVAALNSSYEGPGIERPDGPRNDNDFVDIEDIRIAPTHEELTCRIQPFLPANLYGAPHPHPPESVARVLDIQFRLLREELIAPLRTAIQLVLDDMTGLARQKTQLAELIQKGGGKYRSHGDRMDSVMFNVYTDLRFKSLVPDRRGISIEMSFDAPPGRARAAQSHARAGFWEGASGKRLMQGGLVALVWERTGRDVLVHLGTVASSLQDLAQSARQSQNRVAIRAVFFDATVELEILEALRHPRSGGDGFKILVEAPVMFESIRPFLEALRVKPETIPFGKYLAHHPPGYLSEVKVDPPSYARIPGFAYQLSSLFDPESGVEDLKLRVDDQDSINFALEKLSSDSRLDPSQAQAVMNVLTRELALIQGPPGTGKSYTGVELLRVLLANRVRPILMIAFTNHALDHLLRSVLDAKATTSIVRLGSRSSDERIAQYNIETLEMVAGKSRLERAFGQHFRALKDVESDLKRLLSKFEDQVIGSDQIMEYLEIQYPGQHLDLSSPPTWILTMWDTTKQDTDGAWHRVGQRGRAEVMDESLYAYWREGSDLDFLQELQTPAPLASSLVPGWSPRQAPSQPSNRYATLDTSDTETMSSETESIPDMSELGLEDDSDSDLGELWQDVGPDPESDSTSMHSADSTPSPTPSDGPVLYEPSQLRPSDIRDVDGFFSVFGLDTVPTIPSSERPLDELVSCTEVWSMSKIERLRLNEFWAGQVRVHVYEKQLHEFQRLRDKHEDALRKHNEARDETRRNLLQNVDIIGCTTNGAAKLTSLLKGVSPRVMLVEEAGQVLEAHVLGSLVPSVEHLIMIGDPLQLRPTLNNFALSMDNRRGSELYKFDMSLMERLSSSGFPMSLINVQRRMRPSIADLVRNPLYPSLQDHESVTKYPPVRGFAKDVFFFSHNHKENGGGDESASKYNAFEVEMIRDLVFYLLRQGCYSQEGDIVVLCAYLGQLARVRDALAGEIAVVIDERDQTLLADAEDGKEDASGDISYIEQVKVSKRVLIRTVDNFQGEEAKVVILSLVRNSGGSEDEDDFTGLGSRVRANIGFLKSRNRTNVALSRAREGLIILGNGPNLAARSPMWQAIIEDLENKDAIGDAIPVACHNHPDTVESISKPGKLSRIAPDGGCLQPCNFKLKCGHICPFKCHADDPQHVGVVCTQPCRRLCANGHPCHKQCADPCGDCQFRVPHVELPCGHIEPQLPCHMLSRLQEVPCAVPVVKKLVKCEHDAEMACSQDPAKHSCLAICGAYLACCRRPCNARCSVCQSLSPQPSVDEETPLDAIPRVVHQRHACQKTLPCEHMCEEPCSEDHHHTTICRAPCRQVCIHTSCRHVCSIPCAPCQEPCTWKCSHHSCPVPCGSVCARLPCDLPCDRLLACGHKCPSVCGEDCNIQVCPECASEDEKGRVVDFILNRTLGEVDLGQGSIDELLITIPNCRHTFTVETLDGVCDMLAYYERDSHGDRWLGLKAPPAGFKRPPTCPTCRGAITCPRYGRIYKRADLDILEKNVANSMSRQLNTVRSTVNRTPRSDIEGRLTRSAGTIKIEKISWSEKVKGHRKKNRASVRNQQRTSPASAQTLDAGNRGLFGIATAEVNVWKNAVGHLIRAYESALSVASARSAHVNAWEAAFSYLYQKEMDQALADPARAPRNPNEHALRVARISIGQPNPQADKRFCVEAFWETINIRFTLVELAAVWLKEMKDHQKYSREHKQMWAEYVVFQLQTCTRDASIALDIAEKTGSRRQMTKTTVLLMRANMETFRFHLYMIKEMGNFEKHRDELILKVADGKAQAESDVAEAKESHRAVPRPNPEQEEQWLNENFIAPAQLILDEWDTMEQSIVSRDTFYQPVSMDEKLAVISAFRSEWGFGHTGHYYQCSNGHMYVIGECGGAMERAYCPECGEAIGGTGHNLVGSSSGANDWESLARQSLQTERSPWPHAQWANR